MDVMLALAVLTLTAVISAQLNIECFEPNTNSSTTTTPTTTTATTTTASTTVTTTTTTTTSVTSVTTSTTPTSTETPSIASLTDSTLPTETISRTVTRDPSTSSTSRSAATPEGRTCPPTQGSITDNTKGAFPGGIFAAGVATGTVLVLIVGGLYVVIHRRKCWTSRHQKPNDIPISDAYPTYSGFTPRTEEPINTYDKINPKPSQGKDNPYVNVS